MGEYQEDGKDRDEGLNAKKVKKARKINLGTEGEEELAVI